MATLKQTVLSLLNNDAALGALVTPDFVDADTLPFDGLTTDNMQYDTNGVTILLQGVLRWRGENPMRGPEKAVRRFLEIYLYDDGTHGFDNIDTAKRRIWELLHQNWLSPTDNEGLAWSIWVGDVGEMYDDTLRANMDRMRFQIDLTRKTS
jgi:hypothetical protein